MSRIEWSRRGNVWSGKADGFEYVRKRGEAASKVQIQHDARIDLLARANGYVRVGNACVIRKQLARFLAQELELTHKAHGEWDRIDAEQAHNDLIAALEARHEG